MRIRLAARLDRLVCAVLILAAAAPGVLGGAAPADPLTPGIAQYEAGNFPQALSYFQRAVELAPTDPRGWFWLGATYLQLNRAADAAAALRRAVELDPRNGQAYLFLGLSYLRLNRRDDARRAFELALRFAPSPEYADAARQWLTAMSSGPGTPAAPPPAARPACPAAPVLPAVHAPPAVAERPSRIEINLHDVEVDGAAVVVSGELENTSTAPVQDIRFQATAFDVTGKPVAQKFIRFEDALDAGDGVPFSVSVPTAPPPIWIRLQVLEYVGRAEPTDVTQFPVPPEVYTDLAKSRIRLGLALTPTIPASRHRLCVWIADAGGFPVSAVGARVTLTATTAAGPATQLRMITVGRNKATALDATWPQPTAAAARIEIASVEFAY